MTRQPRDWLLRNGYKPVRNDDGDELGLASTARGAAMITVRLANIVHEGMIKMRDVHPVEHPDHWSV